MTQVRPTYPGSGMNSPIRNEAWQESTEGLGIRDLGIFKVWEDNFEKLKTLVNSMKPDQLESGSKHYQNLAKDMNGTVTLLHRVAQDMVKQWGGKDAQAALEQMNKAYRQAREIQQTSQQVGQAISNHAAKQKAWKQAYGPGSQTDSWVHEVKRWAGTIFAANPATLPAAPATIVGGFLKNNWDARQGMLEINEGTAASNRQFPEGIRVDMPTTTDHRWDRDNPGFPGGGAPKTPGMPGGPGGGGGAGLPNGPSYPGPGNPGGPNTPDLPGPGHPGGPNYPGPGGGGTNPPGGGPGGFNPPGGGPGSPDYPGGPGYPGGPNYPGGGGSGSDLAGLEPRVDPYGAGPGGFGPPGGGGGLPGGGGGGGGLPGGAGGLPGGMPGGAGAVGGMPGAMGGMPGGPGGAGRGRAGMAGMAGMGGMGMGMPMGAGGGHGGRQEERERTTWLAEDEDVWIGDEEAGPSVIG